MRKGNDLKIYISGPITGTEDFLDRFDKAERFLRSKGYIPYNPAKANLMLPKEAEYEEYMIISIDILDMCDSVYMLNNWENSKGANREYGYALGKGKEILYEQMETIQP